MTPSRSSTAVLIDEDPRRHWRRLSVALAFVCATAAVAVVLNRHLNGDVYWLIAAGRYTAHHGVASRDPFLTLSHDRAWYDQQWLAGILFYGVVAVGGLALLSVLYGLLVGLALLPLVIGCRHKRLPEVAGAWLLSLPMLVALLDPRAEGFSLLAFAILLILTDVSRRRGRVWLIPLLFLAWANLHAAFLVGFLFLALVVVGVELDCRRGVGVRFSWRWAAVALAVPAVLATPLETKLLDYLRVLSGHKTLGALTYEWDPSWQHPYTLAYPLVLLGYATWLWKRATPPRRLEPWLVVVGFAVFSTTATRQMVWLGPLAFYLLRQWGRPGQIAVSRRLSLPLLAAAVSFLVLWGFVWGPPPNEAKLQTSAADYVAAHPGGRLAAAAGTGSYLLWRAPWQPVLVDGRFENYSDAELTGVYDVIGHRGHYRQLIARWGVTRVVTRSPSAIAGYQRDGWQVVFRSPDGVVLARPTQPGS